MTVCACCTLCSQETYMRIVRNNVLVDAPWLNMKDSEAREHFKAWTTHNLGFVKIGSFVWRTEFLAQSSHMWHIYPVFQTNHCRGRQFVWPEVQGDDLLLQIFTSQILQRQAGEEAPFLEFIQLPGHSWSLWVFFQSRNGDTPFCLSTLVVVVVSWYDLSFVDLDL